MADWHPGPSARWASLAIALVVSVPSAAFAYGYGTCHGEPIRWPAPVDVEIMPCSAEAGTARWSDIEHAIGEWNRVPAMAAMLRLARGGAQCEVAINHRTEVGYVRPELLDGARAAARVIYGGGCLPVGQGVPGGRPYITEADIIISARDDLLEGTPADCGTLFGGVRQAVVAHELGHLLGLRHEDEAMSLMHTSSGPGRYCGQRAVSPHPDERAGARMLYPGGEAGRDLAASAFYLRGPNQVRSVTPPRGDEHIEVCPGQLLGVRWSAANLGSVAATTTVRWYLSANDIISTRDRAISTIRGVALQPGEFLTREHTLPMPRLAPGEAYYLGFMVDAERGSWELRGNNNSTYTQVRITRSAACD